MGVVLLKFGQDLLSLINTPVVYEDKFVAYFRHLVEDTRKAFVRRPHNRFFVVTGNNY